MTKSEKATQLRHKFVELVQDNAQLNLVFVVLLVVASLIATFGLLINNTAVIIGAMVMAPLWWPIIQFTYGIVTLRQKFIQHGMQTLLVSIGVVLIISAITGWLLPLRADTSEIILRTQPTIIDLFIGLAAAVVGVLALYWPQVASNVSGVAISLALLPPLTVVGLGVAERNPEMITNAGLLFLANMGSIVVAGAVTLYVLGFHAHGKEKRRKSLLALVASVTILLGIAAPLTIYFAEGLYQEQLRTSIRTTVRTYLAQQLPEVEVNQTSVTFENQDGDEVTHVTLSLYVPDSVQLTETFQSNLIQQLSEVTGQTTELTLRTLSTKGLQKKADQESLAREQAVKSVVRRYFDSDSLNQVDVSFQTNVATPAAQVLVSLSEIDESYSLQQEQQLQGELSEILNLPVEVVASVTPVLYLDQSTLEQRELERSLLVLTENWLQSASSSASVAGTNFDQGQFQLMLQVESDEDFVAEDKSALEAHLKTQVESDFELLVLLDQIQRL